MRVSVIMEEKLSIFSNKLDIITAKIENVSQCLEEAETHISNAEDIIAELEARLTEMETKLAAITNQVDDQEVRAHRDNIGVFGVKEGIKEKNVLSFFETWLLKLLNLETTKGRIRLDRCHRSLSHPILGIPDGFIMRLHYPADKMKILMLIVKHKLECKGPMVTIGRTSHKMPSSSGGPSTESARSLLSKTSGSECSTQ